MSANGCLFCKGLESKYKPIYDNEIICSQCVQILLAADQQDLKRAHAKSIEKGIIDKAKAIESFLTEDEIEQRKPTRYNQRIADRKGTAGAIRDKKRIPELSEKRKAPSVS